MYQHVIKRIFDILLVLISLPITLPVMLICALAIKLDDHGPVFYNADRMGKDHQPFKMFKFRSMKVNAPDLRTSDGSTFNSKDDPRQTRVGKILRATSLDELPQLINVLNGTMSIIGPRPDDLIEATLYEGDEARKLEVKPGITGYAQVYGRNAIPWKERLKLDIYYVDHLSFLMDLKVFLRTFLVVLLRKDIYVNEVEEPTVAHTASSELGSEVSSAIPGTQSPSSEVNR